MGVTLKTKGDEKESINKKEQYLFWSKDYLDSHQLGHFYTLFIFIMESYKYKSFR